MLRFATGLPSIPIGGIAELSPKFTISRGGERRFSSRCPNRYLLSCARMDAESTSAPGVLGDPTWLPSAHTCVNMLVMPAHGSQADLETKLAQALTSIGYFGFV